jgi:hypothetical protein
MNALRLLALTDGAEPGFNHRVMDWHDVVMGQTDIINVDNERKSLVMLQSICESVSKQTIYEIGFLSVSYTCIRYTYYAYYIYSSLSRILLKLIQMNNFILLHYTLYVKYGLNIAIL